LRAQNRPPGQEDSQGEKTQRLSLTRGSTHEKGCEIVEGALLGSKNLFSVKEQKQRRTKTKHKQNKNSDPSVQVTAHERGASA